MRSRVALVFFAAIAVGWAAALVIAPFQPPFATLVYVAGSILCHQIPERSLHLAGAQLPVCARCTGLYVGSAAGVMLWAAIGRNRRSGDTSVRRALIVAAAPTAITAATALAGWWDPGNALRATLAVPLGMTVSAVVMAVLAGHLR